MNGFPDTSPSGLTSDAQRGSFKSSNDLGKLPEGGAGVEGSGTLLKHAQQYSIRHSTKGLAGPKPFTAKVKPITNLGKSIGRKRGY
jgi:hypothetical protein